MSLTNSTGTSKSNCSICQNYQLVEDGFRTRNLATVINPERHSFGRLILLYGVHAYAFGCTYCQRETLHWEDSFGRCFCHCEISLSYSSVSSIPDDEVAFVISRMDQFNLKNILFELKARPFCD